MIRFVVSLFMLLSVIANADTLDNVKKRGYLKCGVSTGIPGFSTTDSNGKWVGLDVDSCRAISAAIFNDPSKVKFTPLTAKERFTALQTGEIDVLARSSTWTLSRDVSLGINFAAVNYYDGQGFLVYKKLGIKDAKELDGASICVQTGTTTELNMADFFRSHGLKYKLIPYDTSGQTAKGFETARCDAVTSDKSQLYGIRSRLKKPQDAVVLPNTISKEPLALAVRQGDDKWFNVIKWTHFALIEAEEYGVTKSNIDDMKNSKNPNVKRIVGTEGKFGEQLGLKNSWSYQIIKHIGNYGEMFERNVGHKSPLEIDRSLNNLWNKGGLQYAYPIR